MSAEAQGLVGFVDSDLSLSRQKEAIFRVLARKKERRTYGPALALTAFKAFTNGAARKYMKAHGAPSTRWHLIFSPSDRRLAGLRFVEQFEVWFATDYPALKLAAERRGESL